MPNIHQLIPDIYKLIQRKDGWFTNELSENFATEVARRLQEKFNAPERTPRLRLSKMGPVCPCALWHSIHHPEMAEALPPWAEIKFSYGHILEALVITLAKAAGHEVTGEQDELIVDGIVGHRDCVIDGCLLDVKSASSRSFDKIKSGQLEMDDPFGYLDQLDGYLVASRGDALVSEKHKGYILAIDKQLGKMCLYEHPVRETHIRARIASHKQTVSVAEAPTCKCGTVADGKSGNVKLDTKASYSAYKYACFPKLRTFLYASGPVYLTHVERKPDVKEIDKHGHIIYN
jgi:hypothetical protein